MIKIKPGIYQNLFAILIAVFGIFLIITLFFGFFTNKYPEDNPYLIFPLIIAWIASIFLLLKISLQVTINDNSIEFKNTITKKVFKYEFTDIKDIEIVDTISAVYLIFSFSGKRFKIWTNYLNFEGNFPTFEFPENVPDKFNIRKSYLIKFLIFKKIGREFIIDV
jgi:preprotein translocase subunit SecG